MLEPWLDRFRQHDRHALARLLSFAARGEHLAEILAAVEALRHKPAPSPLPLSPAGERGRGEGAARVVALTGSGGVGKSTLIGKLIELLRGQRLSVAVLACDPQSPLSGGALLGDRFRMPAQPDDGVFIRSLATAGGQGAVAEHLAALVRILEGFGFDVILIETVGAGQGDTVVRELADAVVLLLQPETGDDLQWEKAGLLEIADVVAIHKADLPGSERVEAQVRSILGLSNRPPVPILRLSSKSGDGIESLWDTVAGLPLRRQAGSRRDEELLHAAQTLLASRFQSMRTAGDPELTDILGEWGRGSLNQSETALRMLRLLTKDR